MPNDNVKFPNLRKNKHANKQACADFGLIMWSRLPNDNVKFLNLRKNKRAARGVFGLIIWRSLPNDNVKFPNLRFWRQRKHTPENLSFFVIKYMALLSVQF